MELLKHVLGLSHEYLRKMGSNSSKLISGFNPTAVLEKTEKLYNKVKNAKA